LNKKVFSASNWFVKNSNTPEQNSEDTQMDYSTKPISTTIQQPSADANQNSSNALNKFFVPGWKGESLISKEVKEFIKILNKFHADAKENFLVQGKFSRRIKISIYDEFLSFAEYKSFNCTDLDHYTSFWNELENESSKYKKEIDLFIEIFSFRIAVIYLLKVRFIVTLLEQTETKFDIKNIYYPNAFLAKVFQSGSSIELKSKAFDQNVFSWYRPNEKLKDSLIKFRSITSSLCITELIKTISIHSEKILNEQTHYSHSLSHKNFGLFLNSLLLDFPVWKESLKKKSSSFFSKEKKDIEIISCKFDGDYLESMGLSHWLAQDANKNMKWDQILCPDFKKTDFETGRYLKILNELQFLTFLAQIANIQGKEPKRFVSSVANSHLYNRKDSNEVQKSLLLNDNSVSNSTYDRVILNITDFPKNNPQHFLFNKVLGQQSFLKESGLLFIITSKKLFVPSQKSKVENLLDVFKIEGIFNFDDVKGKGKLGSYIYIFSKKKLNSFVNDEEKKQSCLNFRYFGNLNSFQEFHNVTELTKGFFTKNQGDLPPLFQRSINDYRLEFNQDAIVDGQLIHSSSKDSTKITHPLFFKKLMNLCNSLEYFFDIQNVELNQNEYSYTEESSFFSLNGNFQRDKSPFTIIVDQRIKEDIRIEIINTKSLESKAYEYGHALCSYYYAYPKWSFLNIPAMKEYFNSAIGKQVINLTFSNEIRKVKGNLSKLLIPRFFANQPQLPEHLVSGLKFLKSNRDEILSTHPTSLTKQFNDIKSILPSLVKSYPNEVLEYICEFNKSINNSLEILGSSSGNKVNFNNPLLKSPLLMSKTYPIYPDNKEIYVEFNNESLNQIHSPLTKIKRRVIEKDGYSSNVIEFYTGPDKVVTLYSEDEMISFLEFISNELSEVPISKVLQGISVPTNENLKSILSSYKAISRTLESISKEFTDNYDQLMNTILFKES
jgi:hypothetical protein